MKNSHKGDQGRSLDKDTFERGQREKNETGSHGFAQEGTFCRLGRESVCLGGKKRETKG